MTARNDAGGIVVLISGRGSNLQALLDATDLGAPVTAVVSNEPGAAGLARARNAGIPTAVVNHREHRPRESFDRALADAVDAFAPRLVVLAGFMRVLGPAFVERFAGRCINIHPSLLPKYPGLDTHDRVIAAGDTEHGATAHFVTQALDRGPLIAHVRVPVEPDDTSDVLAARVLAGEHVLLPEVVRWFMAGRLSLKGNGQVWLDAQAQDTVRVVGCQPR